MIGAGEYKKTADSLEDRIFDLIPDNPEILETSNPFDLFKIEEFKCDDLNPSLFQAQYALKAAQVRFKNLNLKSSS